MANVNILCIYRFQSTNSQGIRELKRQDNRTRLRARVNMRYFTYGREEVIVFYPCVNTPQTSINTYSADNHKHFSVVQTLEQGPRRLFFQEHSLFLSMLRTVQYIESNHSETLTSICRVKKKRGKSFDSKNRNNNACLFPFCFKKRVTKRHIETGLSDGEARVRVQTNDLPNARLVQDLCPWGEVDVVIHSL